MKRYQLIIIVLGFLAASFVGTSHAADTSVSFGGAQYVQTGEQQSTDTGAIVNFSFSF